MKHKIFSVLLSTLLCGTLVAACALMTGCNDSEKTPQKDSETENTPPSESDSPATPSGDDYAKTQSIITDYLTIYGRTPVQDGQLKLYWTNSGFSFAFYGTGVTANLRPSSTNPTYYGYLTVYIDGAFSPSATICVNQSGTFTLAENLTPGEHTIEVRKRNEAIYGESATISVSSLSVTDGAFRIDPPDAPNYTIEFIGDSITGGFGNRISDGNGEIFTTATQDGTMTYAALAAKALNANAQVISRSGICFVTGSDRDSMYPYYIQTAALPGNSVSTEEWDFDAHRVDAVVINLGTNDTGARIDGTSISNETFTKLARNFLELIRFRNPNATIVWAYGMMTQSRGDCIKAAVEQLNAEGDYDIYYCELPTMNRSTEGVGTHGHPSYLSHLRSSIVLADFLSQVMDIDVNHSTTLQAQMQIARDFWLNSDLAAEYTPESIDALQAAVDTAVTLVAQGAENTAYLAAAQAIRTAYENLATPDDYSDEYIVLDSCDQRNTWSLNGQTAGIDTEHAISGNCFTTTGSGNINFMNATNTLGIELPEDWQDWYLELWMYVNNPDAIPGGCSIELSQKVDQIEIAWDIGGLDLQSGWNYLCLPISGAVKASPSQFETIQNIRLFLINLPSSVTFKVDDIVLSRGKYALDRGALDPLIETALSRSPEEDSPLGIALARAQQAASQRQVDLSIETLQSLLN